MSNKYCFWKNAKNRLYLARCINHLGIRPTTDSYRLYRNNDELFRKEWDIMANASKVVDFDKVAI